MSNDGTTEDVDDLRESVTDLRVETAWPARRVRQIFIDYFVQKRGHTYWSSSPVVPHDDPTLLFTNAGMNQFKPLFLGTADPKMPLSKLNRAVNSQKCIRAGGKHNDLEDVGKDTYHHTFFEMLGNWSFGSYFKEDAITWAWECLIDEFGLDPTRLYATYFGGDDKQGLKPDEEAKQLWLKFLPANRVLPFGCKDNFWEMGETGPCGPCSEIHYDRLSGREVPELVNMDSPDLIEIWNIVFIQYNREEGGELRELPNKHVDTGMGFERLTSIMQNRPSNYDTDIFLPLFDAIQELTGAAPYAGKLGKEDKESKDMAYRVVADHIRTLTFAISDGAVPSNDGRGYVLRRVLRRAVRYGQKVLGAPPGFFSKLVHVVVNQMKEVFPDLEEKEKRVMEVLAEEERAFNRTLDQGEKHFKKVAEELLLSASGSGNVGKVKFPAKEAHHLYSTMGFPIDLTELMAEEKGLTVDRAGFETLLAEDKRLSAMAAAAKKALGGKELVLEAEQTAWLQSRGVEMTDSSLKYVWHHEPSAKVLALYKGKGSTQDGVGFVDEVTAEDGIVAVILNTTSFYAEQGGQIYDTGVLTNLDGTDTLRVDSVQSYGGYVLHIGPLESGALRVGDTATCMVDYVRRANIAPNHTMTHVLNHALRRVLMKGVSDGSGLCDQKGSAVDEEKLRFDFAWNKALSTAELAEVETIVRERIKEELPVHSYIAPLEKALNIKALRQVFGERYPDPVRVLSVGQEVPPMLEDPANPAWEDKSVEFCGGTHLSNTRDAERFALIEETGIAKGIRRITAVTKDGAKAAEALAEEFAGLLAVAEGKPEDALEAEVKMLSMRLGPLSISAVEKERFRTGLEALVVRVKKYKKEKMAKNREKALGRVVEVATAAAAEGKGVVIERVDFGTDGKISKECLDKAAQVHPTGCFLLVSADEDTGKFGVYSSVPVKEASFDPVAWVAAAIEGAGGGRSGGKAPRGQGTGVGLENVEAALMAAKRFAGLS
ncbi:alanine-trna ligase [Nannochloropsis oceanica]